MTNAGMPAFTQSPDSLTTILFILPLCALVILLFVLAKRLAVTAAFKSRYAIPRLPSGMTVRDRPRRCMNQANTFTLGFPHWLYANRDGSRDRRRRNNRIMYDGCSLFIDNFHVTCSDPIDMVRLVQYLRQQGCRIPLCRLEQEKRAYLHQQAERMQRLSSVNAIVQRFETCPYDFEVFCARLFSAMGFETQVTSRTNDGGFDIRMQKDGVSYIVECKCFSPANPVGRPLLQKLVGANALEQADVMVFVTTSSFSAPAVEYARQFGIRLIDGAQLLSCCRQYNRPDEATADTGDMDCRLTRADLLAYYPPDMRQKNAR